MKKRLKIYVAGPITPRGASAHEAPRVVQKNVDKAIDIGIELMKRGHLPFIPHLSHYINLRTDESFPAEFWYSFDFPWMDVCDALFYIGSSLGADKELEYAKKKKMTIYYSLFEVPSISLPEYSTILDN
jgi:hypothetical protein